MGLLSVLRGGIPIVFMAGKREVAELISYQQKDINIGNKVYKKVRLFLSFAEKFSDRQTGFWFDPVLDFDPPLPAIQSDNYIPWEDLGSTVICCFKSYDGQYRWENTKINSLQLRVRTLNETLQSVKKDSLLLMRTIEKFKDPEVRKEEIFESAEMLSAVNRLVKAIPKDEEQDTDIIKRLKEVESKRFINE